MVYQLIKSTVTMVSDEKIILFCQMKTNHKKILRNCEIIVITQVIYT